MSMSTQLTKRAVELSKAGRQEDARRLLQAVIHQDPCNDTAWLWYARTLTNLDERIDAIQNLLQIAPQNTRAQRLLLALQAESDNGPSVRLLNRPARQTNALLLPKPEPVKPDAKHPASFPTGWGLVLLATLCILIGAIYFFFELNLALKGNRDLLAQNLGLQQSYFELYTRFTGLQQDFNVLLGRNEQLKQEFTLLDKAYTTLAGQYSELEQNYNRLSGDYNALQFQYSSLQQDYNFLTNDYQSFRTTAISPPYIHVYNRRVDISFVKTDRSIGIWEVDFANLEYAIEKGYSSRQAPSLLRFKIGEEVFSVVNFIPFIDPDPFRGVISELYNTSSSEEAFIAEVWNIVTQLATYSNDIGETPRYPLETFLAGGGDCEDTAILFASMIKAAPVSWVVHLVYMDSDNPYDPQTSNHVIVHINTGSQDYLIETTNHEVMQPYYSTVVGWYMEVK